MPLATTDLEQLQIKKLIQCIRLKDHDTIRRLCSKGVPQLVNYNDTVDGDTPLTVAASMNDEELMTLLLELGADPNVQDLKGRTPAMRAAEYGHVQALKLLAEANADMRKRDVEGRDVLFYCFSTPTQRHGECLETVLSKGGNVNSVSTDGKPLVVHACEFAAEDEKMALAVIASGANVAAIHEKTGRTALMNACLSARPAVVRAIMMQGVDSNLVDKAGLTAAHEAAKKANLEILSLLAAHGAVFDIQDNKGNTPVHYATMGKGALCVRYLIQRGCPPKLKNNDGAIARIIAKDNGIKDCMKELRKGERLFAKLQSGAPPAPAWAIHLYDQLQLRQERLSSILKEADAEQKGNVPRTTFTDCLMRVGIELDDETQSKLCKMFEANRDGDINYPDVVALKKLVPKPFLMASFEGKKKKKKKGKPKRAMKNPVAISERDEGPRTENGQPPAIWVEKVVHFTDTNRFDRDHPPTHPLQDDSAWYLSYPQRTYINLCDAARAGDIHTIRNAVRHGLSVDTRDRFYKTPLMIAAAAGNLEMVQYLVENGKNFQIFQNPEFPHAIKKVPVSGCDVNAMDNFKWTPLHHACYDGHLEVVQYLLEHGANMEAKAMNGSTPLVRAVESSKLDVVQFLLDRGAKLMGVETRKGENPVDRAENISDPRVYLMVHKKFESLPKPKDNKNKPRPKSTKSPRKTGSAKRESLPALPKGVEEQLNRRGSILRAASALASLNEDKSDITFIPLRTWLKQPNTEELIQARQIRRQRFGWEIDFPDFESPFRRNVLAKSLAMASET